MIDSVVYQFGRPAVAVAGAGNVAWHLSRRLAAAGCDIRWVWARRRERAAAIAAVVGAEPTDSLSAIAGVDVIIIAVSDNAIGSIAEQIAVSDALVLHTAGSVAIDVLRGCSARYGVMWPIQTLVAGREVPGDAMPLAIEANDDDSLQRLEALSRMISDKVYRLDGEQRRRAHMASVMVSNFGNALNALAEEIMDGAGVDFALLRPLIEATAAKSSAGNLWEQQTGPARRHDLATIEAHRTLLADHAEVLQLYDLMTAIIQSRCS